MTSILHTLAELEEQGEAGALCTIIQSRGSTPRHEGSKMLVFADGRFMGTVGGGEVENRVRQEALDALLDGKSRLLKYEMVDPKRGDPGVCGGTVEVFVEPFLPSPTLVIIGGGHVGKAVAHLAHWLGFRVVVSDDRPEYCTKEANPDADLFVEAPMEELPAHLKITPQTYIVLTTRGVNVDVPGLPPLLDTPAGYIGIIGSKRRWMTTRNSLIAVGVPEEKVKRVISPIGLELNAETPEEIAVSIMAEIIMLRNGGSGKSMDIE
jgi:xanthine dehydrogenase accessory factor